MHYSSLCCPAFPIFHDHFLLPTNMESCFSLSKPPHETTWAHIDFPLSCSNSTGKLKSLIVTSQGFFNIYSCLTQGSPASHHPAQDLGTPCTPTSPRCLPRLPFLPPQPQLTCALSPSLVQPHSFVLLSMEDRKPPQFKVQKAFSAFHRLCFPLMFVKGLGTAHPCWGARSHGIFLSCHHTSLCSQLKQSLLNPTSSWKTNINIFFLLSTHASRAKGAHRWLLLLCPPVPASQPLLSLALFYILPTLSCICFIFHLHSLAFLPAKNHFFLWFPKNSSMPFWECLLANISGLQHLPRHICSSLSLPHRILSKSHHTGLGTHPYSAYVLLLLLLCMCPSYVQVFWGDLLPQPGFTINFHTSHKSTDVLL